MVNVLHHRPRGLEVGASIMSGAGLLRVGNTLPITTSSGLHRAFELQIGKGAQLFAPSRLRHTVGSRRHLRSSSYTFRWFARSTSNAATVGQVANEEHSLRRLGKLVASSLEGIRPDRSRRCHERITAVVVKARQAKAVTQSILGYGDQGYRTETTSARRSCRVT
jgi:ribosomal protein L2